ncbi:hypothetical protein [Myroides sp. DW712]|uniref:hypothetical protein n=1 Tax=Myroides sp. DW712 TaxID=3389800 RepID=UPI00397DB571
MKKYIIGLIVVLSNAGYAQKGYTQLYYNKKVGYDTAFMLRNFEQSHDRNGVWINTIELEVTQ